MALKRLDEEFELKPGTQLLPYMKRLLPSLEGRFQALETERKTFEMAVEDMRAIALTRINEILIPATEDIVAVTSLGFLLGPSSSSVKLELGVKIFTIVEGPQRDTFTPSPYVIVERQANIDDYAIARVQYYTRETGALSVYITAWHGNQGPHTDWVISSTPGMADSTKLYHDAVAPMHDEVAANTATVLVAKDEVLAAAEALESAGLDAQAFIRRDGAVPFIALQTGVHPPTGANDATLVTAAWSRARMIEYAGQAMQRTGDTMTGYLTLVANPINALHAATKQYVDGLQATGRWFNDYVGVRGTGPVLYLQTTGTQQNRIIQSNSAAGVARWQMYMADASVESGGNVGADWSLYRFNDGGASLGYALAISRSNGQVSVANTLAVGAGANITGQLNVAGDIKAYRPGSPTTGVIFLNSAQTAHLYYDGANYKFINGGIDNARNALTVGHLNCFSIYTNGHATTTWGMTSHGDITVNGTIYGSSNLRIGGNQPSSSIEMYDNDWGPMSIHHNGDLIGYLNNGGGWIEYTTNAGHKWIAQYGWLHDYVNGRANAYAWEAANYRWNEANGTFVRDNRWAYAGDYGAGNFNNAGTHEPYGGAAQTGYIAGGGGGWFTHYRFRYMQHNINGNWYTAGYV